MSEQIEIQIDTLSLGLGALGGFIATLWSIAPLLLTGTKAAALTQNQNLLVISGIAIGILSVTYKSGFNKQLSIDRTSLYSGLSTFMLIGLIGLSALPLASALESNPQQEITGDNLKVATLQIEGMVCQGCKMTITNYLESIKGVKKVEASLNKKQATVIYDSDKTSSKNLINADVFKGVYSATLENKRKYEAN